MRYEKTRSCKRKSNSSSISSEINENDEEMVDLGDIDESSELSENGSISYELSIISDDDTDDDLEEIDEQSIKNDRGKLRKRQLSLQKLFISPIDKKKQPHIIFWCGEGSNREVDI